MMIDEIKALSNEELIKIIKAHDAQKLKLKYRFDGDDQALRDFVNKVNIKDDVGLMGFVMTEIFRETIHRGLCVTANKNSGVI